MTGQELELLADQAVGRYANADRSKTSEAVASVLREAPELNFEQVSRVCAFFNRKVLGQEKVAYKTALWRSRFPTAKPEEVVKMLGMPTKVSSVWESRPSYGQVRITAAELYGEPEGFAKASETVIAASVAEGIQALQDIELEVAEAVRTGADLVKGLNLKQQDVRERTLLEMAKTASAGFYPGEVAALATHCCRGAGISSGETDRLVAEYLTSFSKASGVLKDTATSSPSVWAEAANDLHIRPEVMAALQTGSVRLSHPIPKLISEWAGVIQETEVAQEALRHLSDDLQGMRTSASTLRRN